MRMSARHGQRLCRVLHADSDILVAYKDANVLSVPGRTEVSLIENAFHRCNEWHLQQPQEEQLIPKGGTRNIFESVDSDASTGPATVPSGLHVLHRLDAQTSGLLVFPTHSRSLTGLARQLESRQMEKSYEAIVDTRFLSTDSPLLSAAVGGSGCISTALGANAHVPLLQQAQEPDGEQVKYGALRPCHTDWTVLEVGDGAMRLRLQPLTGRTHQLRLHCALPPPYGLGAPIIGDHMYGDPALAAHSYLHELVHRYKQQPESEGSEAAAGVAARLLAQAEARALATPTCSGKATTERGVLLPVLPSCPYLNGGPCSITSADARVPRLLLHASSLTIPDAFLPAAKRVKRAQWEGVERARSRVAGLEHGQQELLYSIPASASLEEEAGRYTLGPSHPSHDPPALEPVTVQDERVGRGTAEGRQGHESGQSALFTIHHGPGQIQTSGQGPALSVRCITLTLQTPF